MLNYKTGNILDAPEDLIAHGVNCVGRFGAGLALQIAERWPVVREKYLEKHRSEQWRLGEIQIVHLPGNKHVANIATQGTIGRFNSGCHVSYIHLPEAFESLFMLSRIMGWSVAMPLIGSGLGGGEWDRIEPMIERAVAKNPVPLTIYTREPR